LFEGRLRNNVAPDLILELSLPVETDGAGDMSYIVGLLLWWWS
jgi:hypothetical protein